MVGHSATSTMRHTKCLNLKSLSVSYELIHINSWEVYKRELLLNVGISLEKE